MPVVSSSSSPTTTFLQSLSIGTIAVLHAAMNLRDKYSASSFFDRFYNSTISMDTDARAKYLEDNDEIESFHVSAAELGQSDQIAPDAVVNNHFICFSNVDGHIYELDGRYYNHCYYYHYHHHLLILLLQ